MSENHNDKAFYVCFDNQDMHKWAIDDDKNGAEHNVFLHRSVTHSMIPWLKKKLDTWMKETDQPLLADIQESDTQSILQKFLNGQGPPTKFLSMVFDQIEHALPAELHAALQDNEEFRLKFLTSFTIDVFRNMVQMLALRASLEKNLGEYGLEMPDDEDFLEKFDNSSLLN